MIIMPALCAFENKGRIGGIIDDIRETNVPFDIFCLKIQIKYYESLTSVTLNEDDVLDYQDIIAQLNGELEGMKVYNEHLKREDRLESMLEKCFPDNLLIWDIDKDGEDLRKKGLLYDLRDEYERSFVSVGLTDKQETNLNECFTKGFRDTAVYFSARRYLPQIGLFAASYATQTGKAVNIQEKLSTYSLT